MPNQTHQSEILRTLFFMWRTVSLQVITQNLKTNESRNQCPPCVNLCALQMATKLHPASISAPSPPAHTHSLLSLIQVTEIKFPFYNLQSTDPKKLLG